MFILHQFKGQAYDFCLARFNEQRIIKKIIKKRRTHMTGAFPTRCEIWRGEYICCCCCFLVFLPFTSTSSCLYFFFSFWFFIFWVDLLLLSFKRFISLWCCLRFALLLVRFLVFVNSWLCEDDGEVIVFGGLFCYEDCCEFNANNKV